jgi:hypothetical protein
MIEPMKNKNHDERDAQKSVAVAPRCRHDHPLSKSTPFADISFRVKYVWKQTQGSSFVATLG